MTVPFGMNTVVLTGASPLLVGMVEAGTEVSLLAILGMMSTVGCRRIVSWIVAIVSVSLPKCSNAGGAPSNTPSVFSKRACCWSG